MFADDITLDLPSAAADKDDAFDEPKQNPFGSSGAKPSKSNTKSKTPVLDNFGCDLTAMAEEGKLDPVVGRKKEIERISQILSRRKKNNPILIGEPGVGKSAIAEGLALRIIQRKVSRILFNKRIVSLDLARKHKVLRRNRRCSGEHARVFGSDALLISPYDNQPLVSLPIMSFNNICDQHNGLLTDLCGSRSCYNHACINVEPLPD